LTPLHLTINDKPVQAVRGQTILQAAEQNGVDIPTLCAYKDLPPFGGCRMCVVEVDGMRGFPTSCTTPAEEGMVIRTETPALQSLRLETFNMLLSEHPLSCLVCPEKGNCTECMMTIRKGGVTTGCGSCPENNKCELQTLAARLGVEDIRLPVKYRFYPVEKHDPFYDRDYNLCILCGRCVQVCEKLHFLSTLTFVERGPSAGVGTAFNRNHIDAGCSFCGACVDRCPTGTLAEKTNKWEGVADEEVESTCPYCAAGCSIRLQVRHGMVIGSLPGEDTSVNGTNLCVHGRFGVPEMVNHITRSLKPWKLVDGHRFEFTWEEAFDAVAEKLSACQPEMVAMQISSSLPVEDLFLAQKFAHQVLHIPDLSDRTHKASGFERLVKHASSFDQLRSVDCVLLAGLDTRYSLSWLEYELKQLKRNAVHLISLNEKERPLERFVNTFLQTPVGEEASIIAQLMNVLKENSNGISLLDQAADALRGSQHPFIVVGSDYLNEPQALDQLALLAEKLDAGVICLPLQGNVYGALVTGTLPFYGNRTARPDVLYCIGDQPGAEADYTIYQNAFSPAGEKVDLCLPTAVFSERDGSFINAELRKRNLVKAVEPAGSALPDWQILSTIARRMGAPGFEFTSTSEIWEELVSSHPINGWMKASWPGLVTMNVGSANDPHYLGSPLSSRVAGLAALLASEHVKAGNL
jgi:predicted molibdopterin-dependent oxidoreductase YjgC